MPVELPVEERINANLIATLGLINGEPDYYAAVDPSHVYFMDHHVLNVPVRPAIVVLHQGTEYWYHDIQSMGGVASFDAYYIVDKTSTWRTDLRKGIADITKRVVQDVGRGTHGANVGDENANAFDTRVVNAYVVNEGNAQVPTGVAVAWLRIEVQFAFDYSNPTVAT